MKSTLPLLLFLFFMVLGCKKDNSSTGPSISLKSYNDHVVNGDVFQAKFSFSQSGGTPSGDSLVIIRRRFNKSQVPEGQQRDTFYTNLPETPDAAKAEFTASLFWRDIQYGIDGENDTCDFRFVLIDKDSRHSDTAATGTVIILQ